MDAIFETIAPSKEVQGFGYFSLCRLPPCIHPPRSFARMNESMVRRSRRECEQHIRYIHTRLLYVRVAVACDAYRLKYSRFLVKVVHVARRIVQILMIVA